MSPLNFQMFMTETLFDILKKPEKLKPYDTSVEVTKPGFYLFKIKDRMTAKLGRVDIITERYFSLEFPGELIEWYDRKFIKALEFVHGPIETTVNKKSKQKKAKS